ncbi:hypothetical protein PFISCL1PPCAC_4712, partial [Pristionchus fissidentatus]
NQKHMVIQTDRSMVGQTPLNTLHGEMFNYIRREGQNTFVLYFLPWCRECKSKMDLLDRVVKERNSKATL